MSRIFICYRRSESRAWVGWIRELLKRDFGSDQIFLDIDSIKGGTRWAQTVDETLKRCSVVIAVIGRDWLSTTDSKTGRRRLDDPDDHVRLELEAALRRGVPLIPLLVDSAETPPRDELPESLESLLDWQIVRFSQETSSEDAQSLREAVHLALDAAPGELRLGSVFAGHEIDSLVGRGGMGVVYAARDLELDRMDALKLIVPVLAQDREFRGRFVRESRIAASIKHPNVLTVYRAGEESGFLYLVMQLVDGSDLTSLVAAEGAFEPGRAATALVPVANALQAAHDQGLVHRDVKPGNILVDRESGHVYLSDFGLARETTTDTGLSTTGRWLGTADYVSPEQIMGEEVDARADVYSLGCVLFQTLTGRVPYPSASETAKLVAHATQQPPSLLDLRPKLPKALDEVVHTAMARDPDRRYQSARELGAALVDAAAPPRRRTPPPPKRPEPETAPPREPEPSKRRVAIPSGRHRLALAAGLVVALAAVAAVVAVLASSGGGRKPSTASPPAGTVAGAGRSGGTVVVATESLETPTVFAQMFEGLTTVDADGKIQPDLAISWSSSADRLRWDFRLRQGVEFSDGTRLDADAVCANADGRWQDNPDVQPFRAFVALQPTCTATDPQTVRLTVTDTTNRLPELLAHPALAIASPRSLTNINSRRLGGTGPFVEVRESPSSEVVLKRNPRYWGPRPSLDELRFVVVASGEAATNAVLTGDLDVLPSVSTDEADRLRASSDVVLLERPSVGALAGVIPAPATRTVAIRSNVRGFRPGAYGWDSYASVSIGS